MRRERDSRYWMTTVRFDEDTAREIKEIANGRSVTSIIRELIEWGIAEHRRHSRGTRCEVRELRNAREHNLGPQGSDAQNKEVERSEHLPEGSPRHDRPQDRANPQWRSELRR